MGDKKQTWRNRITGYGNEPLDSICFNPQNWRVHPVGQQEALSGVLSEVGIVQNVIINTRSGNLIDGHLRVTLAARNGEKEIPVTYVDLSEEEEALILASLDPIGAMAATDKAKLDELLRQVQSDNANVQQMLSDIAEREGIFGDLPSLDDLEEQYGEPGERDFWPVVKVQVSPETHKKFQDLMAKAPGKDEAEKFDAVISGAKLP